MSGDLPCKKRVLLSVRWGRLSGISFYVTPACSRLHAILIMNIERNDTFSLVPDLTACEREPVQAPNLVEPNGCMLVVHEATLAIVQVSSNAEQFLGLPPEALLAMRLPDLFGAHKAAGLLPEISSEGKRKYVSDLRIPKMGTAVDALVHRRQQLLILEFEPSSATATPAASSDISASLTDAIDGLEAPLSLTDLCQRIAASIRCLTGFDRVMVYRFLQDNSGFVIAEDRREDLVPYLGLRYPASDIPVQARRLYLLNTLRLKADVNAVSAALIPQVNPITGTSLDMTYCVLRSMSPVHMEYLRNMGVAASMSISILKDGRLWGLLACQHGEARLVPHPIRITCEVLARVFSSHVGGAEERDERVHSTELRDLYLRLEARLRETGDVTGTLTELGGAVSSAIGSHGCIFSIRGKLTLLGRTPDRARAEALLAWLDVNQLEHLLTSDRLGALYAGAGDGAGVLGGVLSVRIALGAADFLVWLRPPVAQVVSWAGNPDKPVVETEAGRRISPRLSFELWKQTVRDRSEPWANKDQEFASGLRPVIAEAMLLQMKGETARLNSELVRSNVDLEAFAYSASHDLQEPVRAIRIYSQLLARRAGPELSEDSKTLIATIEDSAERMRSLIAALLTYSKLGGTENRESKPVNLEEAFRWVLTTMDDQRRESETIITRDELPTVFADLDHMVRLLQNLTSNAIKYRQPGLAPRIHLSSHVEGSTWLLSMRDNGQGFEPEYSKAIFEAFKRVHDGTVPGHGIGLATCKRIVEIHNGRIWAESGGKNAGATFSFTLPRGSAEQNTARSN
jgi:chemotaxis family two-component system sensor kinase Cph1